MRRRSFILGVLMVILGFAAQAQIYEVYHQGFEQGEPVNYTVTSGSAASQGTFYSGGSKALKMAHNEGAMTVVTLDTIDLSMHESLSYYTLEFSHINNVSPFNCASTEEVAMIEVKLPSSNNWKRLTNAYYDMSGSYSTAFQGSGYFCNEAYPEWQSSPMNSSWWRNERFILNSIFINVAAPMRKLQVRLTLYPKTSSTVPGDQGWWIDDIVVKASPQPIIKPIIKMLKYPDLLDYPTSRGAEIKVSVKPGNSTLSINPDSVYIQYRIGGNPTIYKQTMSPIVGSTDQYRYNIPFYGYDTMMYFRIVAKDASTNENTSSMPANEEAWSEYRCIRGVGNSGFMAESSTGGSTLFPFPSKATAKSEFIVDSATMANAGFKAGAITGIDLIIRAGLQSAVQTRNDVQVGMRNVRTTIETSSMMSFTDDYIQVVYRGNLNFPIIINNNPYHIDLQDTFYYSGKDLIVQIIQNNGSDLTVPLDIACVQVANNYKKTLWNADDEYMHFDPYVVPEYKRAQNQDNLRPNLGFSIEPNQPLWYDAGVTEIVNPSYNNAAQANVNETIKVTFKNLGVNTINAARLTYQLDDETPVSYNWTGSLAGGSSTTVVLTTTQQFLTGYHILKAWVEDTLTSNGQKYRDHEPYNDSVSTKFIACDGAMSGVRKVGGTNPDFSNLDEFLFALSSCGIDGPLTVKLANGNYTSLIIPSYEGGSVANYIQFEPLESNGNVVFVDTMTENSALIDLRNVAHVRFKNITFNKDTNSSNYNYLVQLGSTSEDCQFIGCQFENKHLNVPLAMIYSGAASQLLVKDCQFIGGDKGVDLSGASPTLCALNNKVKNSIFKDQGTSAVYALNQKNIEVDSNYMNDIVMNSGYAILLQNVYGISKITRNKIFISHGAAAIGISSMEGSASGYGIVANNMIVEDDDGLAINIVSPLNVQSAKYVKFVYNSLKLNAPTRIGTSSASFGGVALSHCYIQNNAFVTIDGLNYALIYNPGSETSNVIGNNIYYTEAHGLNRYNITVCSDMEDWRTVVPSDTESRKVNPNYLNGELVDLRAYSQTIKNIATPIPEVSIDMFGASRDASKPCVGAFEFSVLNYDFEIISIDEPLDSYCGAVSNVPLRLKIYNWGVTDYVPGTAPITVKYTCGNVNGNIPINQSIGAGDTILVNTGVNLSFQPNGKENASYELKVIINSTLDPNATNDTVVYKIVSNYVSPELNTIALSVPYNTSASITPTENNGLETWNVTPYNVGLKEPSSLYWFASQTSEDTIFRGNTFVTDPLVTDTVLYVSQHRELPMIRISEIMLDNSSSAEGKMPIRPIWMSSDTRLAIELTNVGDFPANLDGDTLRIVSNDRSLDKIFAMPGTITIQPGASLVVQYRRNQEVEDSTVTIFSGISINSSSVSKNLGVLYIHDGKMVDAVATNSITTLSQWTSLNVPNYLWAGAGVTVSRETAGIVRKSWPTNAASSPSNSSQYWANVTEIAPLTMGISNPNLIVYEENGCLTSRSEVRVSLTNIPNIDLAVEVQPIEEGCGLGNEAVSAIVYNYGLQNCESVSVKYSVGGILCDTETITNLGSGASKIVNFSTPINMHQTKDSLFKIKVWVDKHVNEHSVANDTATIEVMSLKTPEALIMPPFSVDYATSVTLQQPNNVDSLVWYNKNMEVLDTSNIYVSEPMYQADTFYVNAISTNLNSIRIGTDNSLASTSDRTSPYGSWVKYCKAQYIYSASQLLSEGLTAGMIKSISFNLAEVDGVDSVVYSNYTISMGYTEDETFNSRNAWKILDQEVYSSSHLKLASSDTGWIKHELIEPFVWDGQSNIVVQVCYSLQTPNHKKIRTSYTRHSNTALALGSDSQEQCGRTTNGTLNYKLPNAKFEVLRYGCSGPHTKVLVSINSFPVVDAFLSWSPSINNITFSSCDSIAFPITIKNMGTQVISGFKVGFYVDDILIKTESYSSNIGLNDKVNVTLPRHAFTPGRHKIKAILSVANDNVHINDTIEKVFPIRFCGGVYTIGPNKDYSSVVSALDTLNSVGMEGSVIFNISSGIYEGQADFGVINGTSSNHTVTLQSETGNAEDVVMKACPTSSENYVINIDGSQYLTLRNISIYGYNTVGSGNNIFATAVSLSNCKNVTIDSCIVKVSEKASTSNNAVGIVIKDNVSDLTISNSRIDSSYYAIASNISEENESHHIVIRNNDIIGFNNRGISIRDISNVTILKNNITSSLNINNREQIGVYVAKHDGQLSIEKNKINLIDEYTGGKRGLVLTNINGTIREKGRVVNNMISLASRGISRLTTQGITIDSASSYVNIYYNTVRVESGINSSSTKALIVGDETEDCTNINIRDNILSNFCQGYAYYVASAASISTSDYNALYSNSEANIPRFAYWNKTECSTLSSLKGTSRQDQNSIAEEPIFVNVDNLHMAIGQFSALADYNADVVDDVDGIFRPQIPSPTIGAHEFNRPMHDIAIVAIPEPRMPENSRDHPNIEGRKIRVIVKLFNNGTVTERNVSWNAELVGHNLHSGTQTIASIAPREYCYDTTYINTALGIIDTQKVAIHVTTADDFNLHNNDSIVNVYLDPAYNLQVVNVMATGGCAPNNTNSIVKMLVKNVGLDTIRTNMSLEFGYTAYDSRGSHKLDNTLPNHVVENQFLPAILPPGNVLTVTLNTPADLYPHGIDSNFLALRIKGWVYFQYDLHPENDTAISANIQSFYTPKPPVGVDVHIPYATWDTLTATQINNNVIEWYRDSNNVASRFNRKTNYFTSMSWTNTPQYFDDSTYYLATTSTKGCKSNFSKIHVYVNPRVAYDAAIEKILAPLSSGHVYNEKDTVKVRIINHGTQPINNIPVTYLYTNENGTTELQKVTEVCTNTIAPGQTYDYQFDSLLSISTPINAATYRLRVWTDLQSDMVRLNDTLRAYPREYTFKTLSENTSGYGNIEVSSEGLDITRVSFNTLHNELLPLGYKYQNFGKYENPEITPLHIIRGTQDTILVKCINNQDASDVRTRAKLAIWIDYNRNGEFNKFDPSTIGENIVKTEITPYEVVKVPITIPNDAAFGYTRMRVMVVADDCDSLVPTGMMKLRDGVSQLYSSISSGQVHDYLLYIDEVAPAVDAAITRIESPYDYKVDTSSYNIKVVMANKGISDISSATINCHYEGPSGIVDTAYQWTGLLNSGKSTVITLPTYRFAEGTTKFRANVVVSGDIDATNDTIYHEYHRFHIVTLVYIDSFETVDMWYAPQGKTKYTTNLWELGTPRKNAINSTNGGQKAWVTDSVRVIMPGKYGNRSELYSPIIDISQIRPDSLIFQMSKQITNGSHLTLEYCDYTGAWVKVEGTELSTWYDDENGFSGSSNGHYVSQYFPLTRISSNFPQLLQFRFVYVAPPTEVDGNYGEGCAIDDIRIGRAPRPVDVGVVDILEPTHPKYGETIHPTVVIKNFGTAMLNQVNLAYKTYGSNLAKVGLWSGELLPGDTVHYTFESSFIVSSDFPDTFEISSYTMISSDMYWDNDSTTKKFTLSPLDHDLSLVGFIEPLNRVVAGDSLSINVRIRNFGTDPISNVKLTYEFNYGEPVTEDVDLIQLCGGDGLKSMDFINYTFKKKVRASLGYMALTAYGKYDQDIYIYNDTIHKRIEGITSISDLVAVGMVVDTASFECVRIAMMIDNQGSRALNDFEVGFWIDNDTNTMVRRIYHRDKPLASLESVSYLFDVDLPTRTAPYSHVCGYVHALDDNDRLNDTTCRIVEQFVDLHLIRVEVEENRSEDCAVRLVVENIGNLTLTKSQKIEATINGTKIKGTSTSEIAPGKVYHILFEGRIPKSADREYVGIGKIKQGRDVNDENNQTSVIKVLNYFEDIPLADEDSGIILEQNYPNPFLTSTTIEFSIPASGEVLFYVVDVMGRVQYQSSNIYDEGRHSIHFDASSLSSGTYYYSIIYNGERMMRKMVIR